jgi:hypothetical protein|tara:strand:- start:318 stop:503 length:186 start_codon:yes stop_codon:yes gene_type:complete
MKIEIIVISEENNCREIINLSSEGIRDLLKNRPNELLKMIEDSNKKLPVRNEDRWTKTLGF